jgi:Na+-driven multidrug efflux pump
MNPSQRIVLNTAATYTRSVLAVALALFSSRWVLNALGQTDFGIFSVVGSLIIFIVFLNSVMAASAGRHYAFAIGQGNNTEVNRWFNAAFSVHLCLAVFLTLIGWPIGEYLISHVLNIPADRVQTSLGVFRVSLISAFVSMISIPFVAMFTAKQRIAELAVM